MPNLSKIKRDNMIAFLEQLKEIHSDDESIRAFNEIENHLREKKYGLVWEEHSEEVDELLAENIPVLTADPDRRLCKDKSLPWNFIIEGDNLQALYLLEKTHKNKVDCIYIDPPYNSGATDWKYNNDYVIKEDAYRHSKWLSMMKTRLLIAKRLLNPENSIMIVTIDEKEYLRLGCLLEELFPDARIQMVSSVINPSGVAREGEFYRTDEYIYFVKIGKAAPTKQKLSHEWITAQSTGKDKLRWRPIRRQGSHDTRVEAQNQFFPIFLSKDGKKFLGVGETLPYPIPWQEYKNEDDRITIWPLKPDGSEGCWQISQDSFLKLTEQGYTKISYTKKWGYVPQYLAEGERKKIERGQFPVLGRAEDGSIITDTSIEEAPFIPGTQWCIHSHSAREFGSTLINNILLSKRFSFPKSLYAVHDALRFFLSDKPNAIVLDFFAGSGTTGHAVNLLNATDGGKRTFIMVTNNEVSAAEAKEFENKGISKGSKEWESLGIAKYVTWPRTICSIQGCNVKGELLKGNYGMEIETYCEDTENCIISKTTGKPVKNTVYKKTKVQIYPELEKIAKSSGFSSNVKYFKCDWTPRKPENYLLSNVLCLHIKEMIELQNAVEVDNIKNVLILNKSDFRDIIENPEIYSQIENIWVNQNIVLNAEELKLLEAKGFRYIPREFFGQELKEAAE